MIITLGSPNHIRPVREARVWHGDTEGEPVSTCDAAWWMSNVDRKGRFHFTPLSSHLGDATGFGNPRGPCLREGSSPLRLPSPKVTFLSDLGLSRCGHRTYKGLVSVVSVNEASGLQSGRCLTACWFSSSQFSVFLFSPYLHFLFVKGNFTQILALGLYPLPQKGMLLLVS